MASSRSAACSAVNLAGSDPRQSSSSESSDMKWHRSSPLKRRATAAILPLNRERDGVAAAEAQRGDAAMHVAPLHFVQQSRQNPRAGSADGMPNGHGPAVHIYFRQVEVQLARHGERGRGKRF